MVHKRKRKRYSPSPQSSELMWEDANGLEIEETVRRIQKEKQIKPIWATPSMNLAEFQDTNQDLQWENANGKKLGRRKKSRRKKRSTNPQSATPTSPNNNTNLDRVSPKNVTPDASATQDKSTATSRNFSDISNHAEGSVPADTKCGVPQSREVGTTPNEDTVDWERVMSYHPTKNIARENYMSQYIGRRISCRCRGSWRTGLVTNFCKSNSHSEPTWIVTLTDDDNQEKIHCNESDIKLGERRWGNQSSILNLQFDPNPNPSVTLATQLIDGSPVCVHVSIAHLGAPPPPPPPISNPPK